jgi:hypothetical protein
MTIKGELKMTLRKGAYRPVKYQRQGPQKEE